jgi:NADH-quinone oxidoreductase subunit N
VIALLAQVAPTGGQSTEQLPPLRLPEVEYSAMVPHLILLGAALVLLLVASMMRSKLRPGVYAWFTVAAGVGAGVTSWLKWREVAVHGPLRAVANALVIDGFACFLMIVISASVVLGALLADSYLRREDLDGPEFYVLLMLTAAGGLFMATANDLIVLFLGLEVLSIALYVLTAYHRRRAESGEAAMKYFILGAFSSALFLYGIALVYGATGSTNMVEIAAYLAQNVITSNGLLLAGMVLLLVGLGFKVAAVPFHAWTPDVYQGAPTPVTAFMAAAAKAAGFAGLLRVFYSTFGLHQEDWRPVVWALAVLTMLVGSVLALVQSDIKRMLAYSSISHAGYVLIGLQAASERGIAGSLYYLMAYTFMVVGSFAIVTIVGQRGDAEHELDRYRGLAARRPGLALAFTVFLMAQAGIPFTTGFLAKFYVIAAAVDAESYAIALIGMIAAVVAAFFYLRVIVLMYTPLPDDVEVLHQPKLRLPFGTGVVLFVTLAFTLVFGIVPQPVIDFARDASRNLLF